MQQIFTIFIDKAQTDHPPRRPSPIWKLSPKHNGSNLLDSYELQAITRQLNRAIRVSNGHSTPCSFHLRSPFYLHRLDQIYKENSKTSKMISTSKKNGVVSGSRIEVKGTRGLALQLWNKVKCGLVRGWRKSHS